MYKTATLHNLSQFAKHVIVSGIIYSMRWFVILYHGDQSAYNLSYG